MDVRELVKALDGFSPKLWEKHGLTRIYMTGGYLEIKEGQVLPIEKTLSKKVLGEDLSIVQAIVDGAKVESRPDKSVKKDFMQIYESYAANHGRTVDGEKAWSAFKKTPKPFVDAIPALASIADRLDARTVDLRDETTRALDNLYGRGGWDSRDREDYEG